MIFQHMKADGVMGMNCRNASYVMTHNPRRLYPIVDNKLRTKKLALEHDVPVPELYGEMSAPHDIRDLPGMIDGHPSFVVKPAHGSGGNGILVVDSYRHDRYWTCSGRIISWDELAHHLANTLNGQYSLGGHPDRVMVEYRVRFHPLFDAVSYLGVPDIRIIVFKGFPVMAMVRLPTRSSHGKANLHQGAVGVGISLNDGITTHGVIHNDSIVEHPDTGVPVVGIEIPQWEKMLHMAARCFELTGLGYLGVDLVLDAERGPLMLELNARPGLNIQIANGRGLLPGLEFVENFDKENLDARERVRVACEYSRTH